MPEVIDDPFCCIALYADDAKLYKSVENIRDALKLQSQLDRILVWSRTWKLRFNPTKCKTMRITRRINPVRFYYSLGDTTLQRVDSFTDLGVIIQDNLSWEKQINGMIKKADRNLWCMKRTLGPLAPMKAKKLLYVTLVRSVLE